MYKDSFFKVTRDAKLGSLFLAAFQMAAACCPSKLARSQRPTRINYQQISSSALSSTISYQDLLGLIVVYYYVLDVEYFCLFGWCVLVLVILNLGF